MNTIKGYFVTGAAMLLAWGLVILIGKGLIAFDIMESRNSGWYTLGSIIFLCVVLPVLYKGITDVEYFSSGMMILTMFVGGLWLFYGHGMWFTIGWIAFSLTLESTGCFKALHSGFGNVLGHAYVAVAGKPAKKKYL
ncbi:MULTISPECIES: hypothetical protein [Pseudomonas syringae group]|uniref:Uncharacterized protein n=1 Tax=Pseudomonas syringae pv. coriandricola TaxID=264453 RepID=A0A3M3JPV3_9PSED|nr:MULTISPECIES: hypothetical protein [Pseudomonas syringae group]KOP51988.1 hypothetical protein OX88_24605 [Pseudomonas coronafaciens pv. porri]RMN11915.1 hypothetical protein ALQ65_00599 [Pseudomonas syringae pv. coriandricola]